MPGPLWGAAGIARAGARRLLTRDGLVGASIEAAWLATHIATYPLGLLGERARAAAEPYSLGGLGPVQRGLVTGDVEAAGTPILLVHGLVDNRSIFTLLRRGLSRRGFGRIRTMNYPVLTADVREAAALLGQQVEQLAADSGYERVHVIGHSLGGLLARYYVQRLGGDARVHTVVTLGSPHGGTAAARLLPPRICRQLRPDSDVIAELAEPVERCRTRFVAFHSDLDQLIHPATNARIDHPQLMARNVAVRGVGHLSLPINGRVVHEICTTLSQLHEDGTTRQAGVTSIDSDGPRPPAATPSRSARRIAPG